MTRHEFGRQRSPEACASPYALLAAAVDERFAGLRRRVNAAELARERADADLVAVLAEVETAIAEAKAIGEKHGRMAEAWARDIRALIFKLTEGPRL